MHKKTPLAPGLNARWSSSDAEFQRITWMSNVWSSYEISYKLRVFSWSWFIKAYLQSPILSKSGSTNDNLLINVVQWLYNVFEGWSHMPVNASHMLWDMFLLCKLSKVLQISSVPLHVSKTIKTYLWQHSP